MPPAEVFLSHSNHDLEMASRISAVLRRHGIPVFFSPQNIIGAQQWQDEILMALQRCDWFLVLLSPEAVDSMWVRREIAFALNERQYENRIIPLTYRPCETARVGWINLFQRVNFSAGFEAGCRELLRTWGIGLQLELLNDAGG
jgi:TIR domain